MKMKGCLLLLAGIFRSKITTVNLCCCRAQIRPEHRYLVQNSHTQDDESREAQNTHMPIDTRLANTKFAQFPALLRQDTIS
jgi:hypothetical protein